MYIHGLVAPGELEISFGPEIAIVAAVAKTVREAPELSPAARACPQEPDEFNKLTTANRWDRILVRQLSLRMLEEMLEQSHTVDPGGALCDEVVESLAEICVALALMDESLRSAVRGENFPPLAFQ